MERLQGLLVQQSQQQANAAQLRLLGGPIQFPLGVVPGISAMLQPGLAQTLLGQPGQFIPLVSQEAQEAERRASDLLQRRLSDKDWAWWRKTGKITRSSRRWPNVEYLVSAATVEVLRDGALQTRLCLVAAQSEPWPDRVLTILDWLDTDEMSLWRAGNITFTGGGTPMDVQPTGPPAQPPPSRIDALAWLDFPNWTLILATLALLVSIATKLWHG